MTGLAGLNGPLGYGLVLGALAFAAFGAVVGLTGGLRRTDAGYPWVLRSVYGFFGCMIAANLTMVHALLTHDFSVRYVAQVGSRATPTIFTIVSLWSALEGSILFWGAILGTYLFAFTRTHRDEHSRYMSLALGTMLAVGVFFAFLIAGPANPFGTLSPVPADGPGPNALLQNHVLMIIHPPMLYLGYVGMVVPFGIAAGGLLRGELSDAWMVPLRRWSLIPFGFLSVGIILGAWWAYAVLGWGGYWAWDPVENASILPWFTITAFIHSTMVHERRKMLKLWTLSLALVSFILTILGTFMTRSGVFNSVHSFTQSDIGPTFLGFLGVIFLFSFALLTLRGHLLVAEDRVQSAASREMAILVNNLLFTAITFTVLLGTVWPLISEAVRGVRVSVGEPYFNFMAVPLGVAVLFLMGIGPVLPWGTGDAARIRRQLWIPGAFGAVAIAASLALGLRKPYPILTFGFAAFVAVITLRELFLPVVVRMREHREGLVTALFRSATRARRRFGGYVVHLGMVFIFVAVAASSSFVTHQSGTLKVGQALRIGDFDLQFQGLNRGREPHREWIAARFQVARDGKVLEEVNPRLNYYEGNTDPIGTPAVRSTAAGDLYLSLLAFSLENNTASLNSWIFPLVGWIWWSIPLLVGGTLIAAWPSRRRIPAVAAAAAPNAVAGGGAA